MADWIPLTERLEADSTVEVLLEGVPKFLQPSLKAWLRPTFVLLVGSNRWRFAEGLARTFERRLRGKAVLPAAFRSSPAIAFDQLIDHVANDEEVYLNLLDFALSGMRADRDRVRTNELERILREAGSAYTVVETGEGLGLQRRVAKEVRAAGDLAMSTQERASVHLQEAWQSVYGLNPNPSHGYREAVRAVEAAAKPVVTPKNPTATLGTIIPALRDGIAGHKWAFVLTYKDGGDGTTAVVEMMRLLWQGQHDRHGTDDDDMPINVSQSEAEAAVHLATTLVQWFQSGAMTAVL
jgi:hypothetical protein